MHYRGCGCLSSGGSRMYKIECSEHPPSIVPSIMTDFNAHFGITNLRAHSQSSLGALASKEHDSITRSGYIDDINFTLASLEGRSPHNSGTFPYNDAGFQSEVSPVSTFKNEKLLTSVILGPPVHQCRCREYVRQQRSPRRLHHDRCHDIIVLARPCPG